MESAIDKNIDYYKILLIERNASLNDIKKAYKKLVLAFHPDVNKNNEGTEKYKEIVKAYTVLKDNELRTEYDKILRKCDNTVSKISFKYCYHEFVKIRNDLWNKFKIIFKDISGKKVINYNDKSEKIFDIDINIDEEILKMPVEELEQRLEYSNNIYVRINAALGLGMKKEKRAFTLLEKIVTTDPDYDVKRCAVWAISNLRMKKSLNFLKILFFSANSCLKLDILKAVYKMTDGKGNLLNDLFITAFNDKNEEIKTGALELFLKTKRKLFYRDIKGVFSDASLNNRVLLDRLIKENRIVDYTGEK